MTCKERNVAINNFLKPKQNNRRPKPKQNTSDFIGVLKERPRLLFQLAHEENLKVRMKGTRPTQQEGQDTKTPRDIVQLDV